MTARTGNTSGNNLPGPELFSELQQVGLHAAQRMFDSQSRHYERLMSLLSSQQQRLATARTPMDLMSIQMALATEYPARLNECVRESFEAASESQQELMECLERCGYAMTMLPTLHCPPVREAGRSGSKSSRTGS